MQIIKPSVKVVFHYPEDYEPGEGSGIPRFLTPEVFLERAGRTCYKSEDRITADSAPKFIKMLFERGHHAMLEHCVASCLFICDRGVTHELVRHRLASYAQESTRYCNYGKDKFGAEISVIQPPGLSADQEGVWRNACEAVEKAYMILVKNDCPPQIARSILPTCLKTEIWTTANLREWVHIFKLRCAPTAHPQIREVMLEALDVFRKQVPSMFQKLWEQYGGQS